MRLIKFLPIVILLGCNNSNENVVNKTEEVSTELMKSDSLSIEVEEKNSFNDSVSAYFNKPVDFYKLKKATMHMHSGGDLILSNDFFHSVNDDRYVYYNYWAIEFDTADYIGRSRSLSFKVLKPWTENTREQYYETDNEILIGIKSKISWSGLEASNFVGQSAEQVKERFGEPNFNKNECVIYYLNDKLLVLKIDNGKVKWFKYIWLRTDFDSINNLPSKLYEW